MLSAFLTSSPLFPQIALHFLSSLPPPLSSFTELQLLSSKTFGRCESKCRLVRQLHSTPPTAHTHDTVFFALVECNAMPEFIPCHRGGGGEVALVALDALLSSKSVGFARCETSSCDSRQQVSLGHAKCNSFSLCERAPHSFTSTPSASVHVCGSFCRSHRVRCVGQQHRSPAYLPHIFCSGCCRMWLQRQGSRERERGDEAAAATII